MHAVLFVERSARYHALLAAFGVLILAALGAAWTMEHRGHVVTGMSNRARRFLGRVHARTAPPPVRILEGIFGMLDHRVLVALCAAEVPDALTRPMQPVALAQKLGVDAQGLERLLQRQLPRHRVCPARRRTWRWKPRCRAKKSTSATTKSNP